MTSVDKAAMAWSIAIVAVAIGFTATSQSFTTEVSPEIEMVKEKTYEFGAIGVPKSIVGIGPDCSLRGPGADLHGCDLSGADFRGADLPGADFRDADLSGANLSGADLYSADLSGANLINANLINADFRHTFLYNTNLSGADLRSADLSGANLRNANLDSTDLSGATLSGVKNLALVDVLSCLNHPICSE